MEIKDDYYLKIIDSLNDSVIEFTSIFDKDDGVYPILGDFGQFVILNKNNIEIVEKCFYFINESIEKGGKLTREAISIQIFELFYLDNDLIELARKNLKGSSLDIFEEYLKKYRSTYI